MLGCCFPDTCLARLLEVEEDPKSCLFLFIVGLSLTFSALNSKGMLLGRTEGIRARVSLRCEKLSYKREP